MDFCCIVFIDVLLIHYYVWKQDIRYAQQGLINTYILGGENVPSLQWTHLSGTLNANQERHT